MSGLNNCKKVKKLFRTAFVILMILALPFASAHGRSAGERFILEDYLDL